MTEVLARLDGIIRHFGHVKALDSANLEIHSGEIHGILGENGAGKTTLLNILGGIIHPDVGFVEVGGSRVRIQSARAAWKMGIGLVHQHFTLVPGLSVLENLALGRRHRGHRWKLHLKEIRKEASQLSELTGLTVPFEASIEELGVGDRQRIEILKALLRDPQLLVLDEPTAVLAPAEINQLFRLLRSLAEEGRAVVLVAHKLDEILSIVDRVTVLRQGRTVMTAARADVDTAILTDAMVGSSSGDGEAPATPD
ncbi:MAG TPA: heme ABC transporter ATP-binding protein, partial [Gemmatimonadetes bacterium]|nr:heme ABC transporter ATP-binding protein [Gemmatimonadota bacterium]